MLDATTSAGTAGPRRLSRDARREQLVAAAMPVIAETGFADFSLDDVAARAGVTRNLLYHYFPRGRSDLVIAVAEEAGHRLTDDWITDESMPLPERLQANNARMIEHAMEPSDAWTIYQLARGSSDPEIRETVERFVEVVIGATSLNQLGTTDPPPAARIALRGYLAFFGAVLDEARSSGTSPERILPMLGATLVAALGAAGD
ncbi:MAG: TetR/AcrR family transcriptional regulator [Solirubrobacterales bacterium]|nr:TetR/AcrR family transcriptional regulator [Solirubrobacterales bacterium]